MTAVQNDMGDVGDGARATRRSVIALSRTHEACKELVERAAAFNRRVEERLNFICRIIANEEPVPDDCEGSAAYAEKQLEPLLEELREVYASAELIRSVIWQEQQCDQKKA